MGFLKENVHLSHWTVAVASLVVVVVSYLSLKNAVEQIEKQANLKSLELRPYLTIQHELPQEGDSASVVDYQVEFGFCDEEKDPHDFQNWARCDEVQLDNLSDSALFCFVFRRKLHMSNVGLSPLRVTHFYPLAMSEHEWVNTHDSSAEKFLNTVLSEKQTSGLLSFDVTLLQSSSHSVSEYVGGVSSVRWADLKPYLPKGSLKFYPYSLACYEGQVGIGTNPPYSTLYMEEVTFPISITGKHLEILKAERRRVKRYRFFVSPSG